MPASAALPTSMSEGNNNHRRNQETKVKSQLDRLRKADNQPRFSSISSSQPIRKATDRKPRVTNHRTRCDNSRLLVDGLTVLELGDGDSAVEVQRLHRLSQHRRE